MLFLLGIIPIGICALLGWHLLFGKDVQSFAYRIRMEHRLREMRKEKVRPPWLEKLDRSLCVVLPGAFSSELFLGGSVFLFFVSFITGLRSFSLMASVFLGILIASVPFLFLYLRLRRWTKGYTIKQPNMDCQPTEITALMRHRAVFFFIGRGRRYPYKRGLTAKVRPFFHAIK